MASIIDKTYKALCFIVVVCLAAMTAMVFTNTFLRYTFKFSIISSEELSRFLFVWMIFCGGIIAMADGIHIRVDLLTARLPKKARTILEAIVDFLMMTVCAILAYGGYVQTSINLTNYAPATNVPLGYVYSSVIISGVGMCLICLVRCARVFIPGQANKGGANS
ncbi:MAG: TRAP transporter small permease [Planctomycetota bacterium]|jgi:TRAP-type C4-dicarboxylate transport system permease small subunit|nr:TRAP transporter small permease [Planctomycetota bacterium]